MAADLSKLSYFSLPGEIRNKIMNLVLVPGDVYPHTPVSNTSSLIPISAANVRSRSGVQLLATCRQAYDEGHALFYSSNTFHLPATETFDWPDRLQPKHKCLIKRIGITIGPNELDASMISHIDRTYTDRMGTFIAIHRAVYETTQVSWRSKMNSIAAWTSLEEVTLCLFNEADYPTVFSSSKRDLQYHERGLQYHERTLQHCELVAKMEDLNLWFGGRRSPYWDKILWWPRVLVLANIFTKNGEIGWAATMEWLYMRKPGELAGNMFWGWADYMLDNIEIFRTWQGLVSDLER